MNASEAIFNLRQRSLDSPNSHIRMTWEEAGMLTAESGCKVKEVGQVRAWGQFAKGVELAEKCRLFIGREYIGTVTKDDVFDEKGFTFAPSTYITHEAVL